MKTAGAPKFTLGDAIWRHGRRLVALLYIAALPTSRAALMSSLHHLT